MVDPIVIATIRKFMPGLMAQEMLSVQSMAGVANIFTLKSTNRSICELDYIKGNLKFTSRGVQRMYHGQWIPEDVWWKLKIKGF